jgi:hypothetical protein
LDQDKAFNEARTLRDNSPRGRSKSPFERKGDEEVFRNWIIDLQAENEELRRYLSTAIQVIVNT